MKQGERKAGKQNIKDHVYGIEYEEEFLERMEKRYADLLGKELPERVLRMEFTEDEFLFGGEVEDVEIEKAEPLKTVQKKTERVEEKALKLKTLIRNAKRDNKKYIIIYFYKEWYPLHNKTGKIIIENIKNGTKSLAVSLDMDEDGKGYQDLYKKLIDEENFPVFAIYKPKAQEVYEYSVTEFEKIYKKYI